MFYWLGYILVFFFYYSYNKVEYKEFKFKHIILGLFLSFGSWFLIITWFVCAHDNKN